MAQRREAKRAVQRQASNAADYESLSSSGYSHDKSSRGESTGAAAVSTRFTAQKSNNNLSHRGNSQMSTSSSSSGSTDSSRNSNNQLIDVICSQTELKKAQVKSYIKKWSGCIVKEEKLVKEQCLKDPFIRCSLSLHSCSKDSQFLSFSKVLSLVNSSFSSSSSTSKKPEIDDMMCFFGGISQLPDAQERQTLRFLIDDASRGEYPQPESSSSLSSSSSSSSSVILHRVMGQSLGSRKFSSLCELKMRVKSSCLHTAPFFDSCVTSIDYPLLKVFEISFIEVTHESFVVTPTQLMNLSYKLKTACKALVSLVIDIQAKITPSDKITSMEHQTTADTELALFSENLGSMNRLNSVEISLPNAARLSSIDIAKLLTELTRVEKTKIWLFFEGSKDVCLCNALGTATVDLFDNPTMQCLRSLVLRFPVKMIHLNSSDGSVAAAPTAAATETKRMIVERMNRVFEKTPYLSQCQLFVKFKFNVERLITLRSFNAEKMWVQIQTLKKTKLLQMFRRDVFYELLDLQEIFVF